MLVASPYPSHSGGGARRRNRNVAAVARRMNGDRGHATQFRQVFHRCQVPMLMVDHRRRYVDANRAARLLFRLSLAELRRRQIDDLSPRAEIPRLESFWAKLLERGQVCGDYEVRFEDGSELQVVFSALANVLPGEHLIVFAPARWPDDELGALKEPTGPVVSGPLSPREREVLALIAAGLSVPEIAQRLTISVATVRTHAQNVYRKLGARNRPHAVALGLQLGLIQATNQPEHRSAG